MPKLSTSQNINEIQHKHISTPTVNPPSGYVFLYFKSDGRLYAKDSAGTEMLIAGGSGLNAQYIQGNEVISTSPSDGQFYQWDSGTSYWVPVDITEADISDLDHDAVKLQGNDIDSSTPSANEILRWESVGNYWIPSPVTESIITDLDHDAVKLQGNDIDSSVSPSNNEALLWNSAQNYWTPLNITDSDLLNTVSFDGLLTASESSIQAALDVVDDVTLDTIAPIGTVGQLLINDGSRWVAAAPVIDPISGSIVVDSTTGTIVVER